MYSMSLRVSGCDCFSLLFALGTHTRADLRLVTAGLDLPGPAGPELGEAGHLRSSCGHRAPQEGVVHMLFPS